MKLMLEEQLKSKVQLQIAVNSTDTDEVPDQHPASSDQLEMTKTQSYMSDHRFNGEIGTPSKLEEKEQIHIEEL